MYNAGRLIKKEGIFQMKRNKRRHFLVPILLVAAMVVSVTGCGEKFDASRYVKGCLDASTKGVF